MRGRKKTIRREEFLQAMNNIIPWEAWIDMIHPYYQSGKRGRPLRGVETMLRMYLLQLWCNLSDVGVEGSIYDSYAILAFMGIDFLNEQAPDSAKKSQGQKGRRDASSQKGESMAFRDESSGRSRCCKNA